ncbi:MAG: Gfo/Idh/MocA family oxidoreductase [Candidatus Omnitrophica bacterium]|nr:Gfo/Idh/MocA family oxidoreductase [Candidatus Omnitrophota bacterium]
MKKVYGFGIIGAGEILSDHALSLQALKSRARFIGLSDIDSARLKRASNRFFVPFTYTDYKELLKRSDIDIIVVATPPSTHEELVFESLNAGKHVICEKPLAHTLESADRIIEYAAKRPNKLAVCYQVRYMPAVQRVIWLRDRGMMGKLQSGNFLRVTPMSAVSDWWGKWDIAGGGVVMTQFIHQLDIMLNIFGKPVSVYARMDTFQQNIESEDSFVATVEFENGALVNCSATINAHRLKTQFDVIGDMASAHFPWTLCSKDSRHLRAMTRAMVEAKLISGFQNQGLVSSLTGKIRSQFGADGIPAKVLRKILPKLGINFQIVGEPPLHKTLIEAFLDALDEDGEVPVSAEDARRSLELCTAIYTSAIMGESVSLPLQKSTPFYKGITASEYQKRKSY